MDRSSAIDVVCRVGWLSRQPQETRDLLLAGAGYRHYAPGEQIYSLGDDAGGLYGLAAGELKVLIAPMSLPPTFVHIAQPGWWVGDGALISNTPRRAGLTAKTQSWLFHIEKSAFEHLAAANPWLWRSLAQITVSHLDHALGLLAALTQKDARIRVLAALALITGTSGQMEDASFSLTHEELGEMTRLTRSTVRKILLDLQEEGLLRMQYGRVTLADPDRLRQKLARMGNSDRNS